MTEPPPRDAYPAVRRAGCIVLALLLLFGCLLPLIFVNLAQQALENLHLSPAAAMLVLLGMIVGSLINVPVARFPLDREVIVTVFEPVGGWRMFPRFERLRQEMIVAVNVGGCVIPVLLAVWLQQFILEGGQAVVTVMLIAAAANVAACYALAVPVPNLGIALPTFLPALVALTVTWLGLAAPEFDAYRGPVAFTAGIAGPLIGADLLHWRDFRKVAVRVGSVSIGGAGTWDGIVLSGLTAALLA